MKKIKSIEFKGTVATISTLTVSLRSNKIEELSKDLRSLCGDSPDFFNQDVAILDATTLPGNGTQLDWPALVAMLRSVRLNPIAVRNPAVEAEENIRAAGLTLASEIETSLRKAAPEPKAEGPSADTELSRANTKSLEPTPAQADARPVDPAPAVAARPDSSVATGTVVIDRPLRSGQQIYARNADLVVLAMVNPGAEVMADGNIHVYAPLRGRAMAGASGNTRARILTTCFEAELVSVGGVYRPLEPGMPKEVSGKPAQVRLIDSTDGKQSLQIEALKIV